MSIYTARFNTKTLQDLFDIESHTIRMWIKRGNLLATKTSNGDRDQWEIKGGDVIDFTYFNPKYRNILEEREQEGYLGMCRAQILREVYKRKPRLYNLNDICTFLNIADSTIQYWVRAKGLEQVQSPRAISYHLYTLDAVKQIFEKDPNRYWKYLQTVEEKRDKLEARAVRFLYGA